MEWDSFLVRYEAALVGNQISTFRPTLVPSSSRNNRPGRTKCRKVVQYRLTLEGKGTRFSSKAGIRLPIDTASRPARSESPATQTENLKLI
jgi:hypothetical protein